MVANFAKQAVVAIENVRLLNELRARTSDLARSVEELRVLGEVSQSVNSTLDLPTVLSTIVSKAVQLSMTDAGAIYVAGVFQNEFRLSATHGMDEALIDEITAHGVGLSEPLVAQAAAQRAPIQIADLSGEPLSEVSEILQRAGYRSLLMVPLLGPDRIVGTLAVRRKSPGDFQARPSTFCRLSPASRCLPSRTRAFSREIGEKSRQLALASQHKSQFLANMSHELRTPLNAILGYTELIIDDIYGETPEKIASCARARPEQWQTSARADQRRARPFEDRGRTVELDACPLFDRGHGEKRLCRGRSARSGEEAEFRMECPTNLPAAHGDERRLTQVLINLIGNAIKFTDAGEVAIGVATADGSYTVAVRDTGPGIAAGRPSENLRGIPASRLLGHEREGRNRSRSLDLEAHRGDAWRAI